MTDLSAVLVESANGVARVTLNRPHRRNALDGATVQQLCDGFRTLGQDSSIRAIVLGATGSVFCAGADLRWMGADHSVSETRARQDAEQLLEMFRALDACPCPVIARVQGPAYGGALGLIAACDVAVAADEAVFGLSEARLGLVPAIIAPFVARKVGASYLRRYGLTGEVFSAATAKEAGLVHDVVPGDAVDARIDELLQMIRHLAPRAVRAAKQLFLRLPGLSEAESRSLCVELNVQARLSPEAHEGLSAFHERRPPLWAPRCDATTKPEGPGEGKSCDVAIQRT
jgi:methylglutaconyl-CoA hydratase